MGDGCAAGFADDVEDDAVGVRFGDAEAGSEGGSVREELAGGLVFGVGAGDRGAAAGLEGIHLWAFAPGFR